MMTYCQAVADSLLPAGRDLALQWSRLLPQHLDGLAGPRAEGDLGMLDNFVFCLAKIWTCKRATCCHEQLFTTCLFVPAFCEFRHRPAPLRRGGDLESVCQASARSQRKASGWAREPI